MTPGDPASPDPADAATLCERGADLIDGGRYDDALALLTETVLLNPAQAKAYYYRGIAFYYKEDYAAAVADFSEALGLAPGRAEALRWRGSALLRQDDPEQALADFDQVIRLGPEDANAFLNRGVALQRLGDRDAALVDYTRSVRLEPKAAVVYRYRGQVHFELGETENALADLNEALRLAPDDTLALVGRGNLLHADGDLDGTARDFTEAIRLDPGYAVAYLHRGEVECRCGRLDQAVQDFTEAIRLDPTGRRAYEGRASAWEDLGEDDKAEADFAAALELRSEGASMSEATNLIHPLLKAHFDPRPPKDVAVTERRFPSRVRADLQRAIDSLFGDMAVRHFCGVRKQYAHEGVNFTDLLVRDRNDPPVSVPPQYEEVDIGEEDPVRCLQSGLWLLEADGVRFAVFLEKAHRHGYETGIRFQVAAVHDEAGAKVTQKFFKHLEGAVRQAQSYRGKVLSLEWADNYSGASTGITVHKLRHVKRDQVILPRQTLELLERNVIQFVRQRPKLAEVGMATKKGLLFYGPPGTGKTHTIHYLAGALEGTTTLLISAEQVGLLGEYMTLARLLQPSMVVIEDADLIARERTEMNSACEEVLLNKLLNEMDGLKEDADILFVLTTNRPEALEAAPASRPGRVDQAIEFPFPDEEGRRKLIRLYARGVRLPDKVVRATVKKTKNVSAAFIKELMRRSAQFRLERDDTTGITVEDVDDALEELLFRGGSLNRKLLGGQVEDPEQPS